MATKKKTETLGKTPKKTKAQMIKELSKEIKQKIGIEYRKQYS
jgi:hypothetical protein